MAVRNTKNEETAELEPKVKTDKERAAEQAPTGYTVDSVLRVGNIVNATLVSESDDTAKMVIRVTE